jgi:hypothetical protein
MRAAEEGNLGWKVDVSSIGLLGFANLAGSPHERSNTRELAKNPICVRFNTAAQLRGSCQVS